MLIQLYGWQLFSALEFVNGLGIAHRDVKPANLLVDDVTGRLKLGDFGSAVVLQVSSENNKRTAHVHTHNRIAQCSL